MHLGRSRLHYLMVQVVQVVERSARNSHPSRTGIYCVTGGHDWGVCRSLSDKHGLRTGRRSDKWSYVDQGRWPVNGSTDPRTPATGLPPPAESGNEHPSAVPVRQPSPRIGRGIHVSETGIPAPGAVHKGIPANTSEVRLPHHPVARHVVVGTVVIQIAEPIPIGR